MPVASCQLPAPATCARRLAFYVKVQYSRHVLRRHHAIRCRDIWIVLQALSPFLLGLLACYGIVFFFCFATFRSFEHRHFGLALKHSSMGQPSFYRIASETALAGRSVSGKRGADVCAGLETFTPQARSVINPNRFSRVLSANGYELLESAREETIPG